MLASALLCIACYGVTVFVPSPLPALLGCAFCGLSVSLMWPGTISLSAARFPGAGTALFGMLALAGDLGCSLGPWLTGAVSDAAQRLPFLQEAMQGSGLMPDQWGLRAGLAVAVSSPCCSWWGSVLCGNPHPLRCRQTNSGSPKPWGRCIVSVPRPIGPRGPPGPLIVWAGSGNMAIVDFHRRENRQSHPGGSGLRP